MDLFRQVAMEVGQKPGYANPLALDEQVTIFVKNMKRQEEHDHYIGIRFERILQR